MIFSFCSHSNPFSVLQSELFSHVLFVGFSRLLKFKSLTLVSVINLPGLSSSSIVLSLLLSADAEEDGIDAEEDGIDAEEEGVDAEDDGVDAEDDGVDAEEDGIDAEGD